MSQFDDSGQYWTGCTARSVYEECSECQSYHKPGKCPPEESRYLYAKWRTNDNFDKRISLFNFWEAKKHIKQTNKVILVESPLNVLRLVEAGYEYGLGLYGAEITEEQEILLQRSAAMEVRIIMDNDETGEKAASKIAKKLSRGFNVKIIKMPTTFNDLADMKVQEVKDFLRGKI